MMRHGRESLEYRDTYQVFIDHEKESRQGEERAARPKTGVSAKV